MKAFWMFIVVPAFAIWLVTSMMRKSNPKKENKLYYPVSFLLIFVVVLLMIIAGVITFIRQEDYGFLVPLVIIGLPVLILFVHWTTWSVSFFDDCWFFRRKKFLYEDITKIVYHETGDCFIFVGRKKFIISPMLVNNNAFIQMLKKKKVFKNAEVIQKK